MRFKSVYVLLLYCVLIDLNAQQENNIIKNDLEKITLHQAIENALVNNHRIKIIDYEIKSLEKKKIQAGLFPNPELDFESEDFIGGKELRGFIGSQFTLLVKQIIELGDKRNSRTGFANNEIIIERENYKIYKLDLITEIKSTFFDLYLKKLQIVQQEKFIGIYDEITKTIADRVKAGKTSNAEESRAKISSINSKLELQKLQREYLSIQTELSSLMGMPEIKVIPLTSYFDSLIIPPSNDEVFIDLDSIPSLKLLYHEANLRKANLRLEESHSTPDLTASFGIRYLNEIKTNSFVAGLSIPLQIFNSNKGSIQSAEIKINQMDEIIKAQKLFVIASLNKSYNNLIGAYNNAEQLKENILPESENAYEITKHGYLQGRFAFIDLLDSHRILFEAQVRYLSEISNYYSSLIEIEKTTGKNFIK